ncbi:hypothetical protein T12_10747 [Trichinella patagoniensis]|uniref:Uncharacterized protein n=1 Tax=Trichinella patagoniensis TaxID=990121 RepID=A0A0V0YWY7_9BILA|nr:hypothetical protein T12_10747 [Trichinella patagoniensis]
MTISMTFSNVGQGQPQDRHMATLEAIYSTRTHLFAVELSKTY